MRSILVALICLSGCGIEVDTLPLRSPYVPAHAVGIVDVLASAPARPHVDVALMYAGSQRAYPLSDFVTALRAKAAAIGCDALIITSVEGHSKPGGLLAACIAYLDAPVAAR